MKTIQTRQSKPSASFDGVYGDATEPIWAESWSKTNQQRLAIRTAIAEALLAYYADGGTRPVEELIGKLNG